MRVVGVVLCTAALMARAHGEPMVAALSPEPTAPPLTVAPLGPASPPPPETRDRDVHVGLNLRTDFGARFYRMDLGVRVSRVDLIAVVDPFGVYNGDYDFDGVVRYDV